MWRRGRSITLYEVYVENEWVGSYVLESEAQDIVEKYKNLDPDSNVEYIQTEDYIDEDDGMDEWWDQLRFN